MEGRGKTRYDIQNAELCAAILQVIHDKNNDPSSTIAAVIVDFMRALVKPQSDQLESGLSKIIFCEFTCDNLHFITGSSSGSLKIWNFETCELVDKVRGCADLSSTLSHHGEWVTYNETAQVLTVLEVATVKPVCQFRDTSGRIICNTFSRSNEYVLTGGHGRVVNVWSMETKKLVRTLSGHTGFITVLKCTHNDKELISAADDRTLRIWDLHTGRCKHVCGQHSGWISSIAITSDQRFVVSGSVYVMDRTVKVWNIETGECVHNLEDHGDSTKLICTYDNTVITAGEGNFIYVWDLEKGQLENMIQMASKTKITCYCSISDSKGVIGGYYGKLDLWSITKTKRLKKNKLQDGMIFGAKDVNKVVITAVDVSHQGYVVACTNGTSNCRIWYIHGKENSGKRAH